jgi:hypothetical protein
MVIYMLQTVSRINTATFHPIWLNQDTKDDSQTSFTMASKMEETTTPPVALAVDNSRIPRSFPKLGYDCSTTTC